MEEKRDPRSESGADVEPHVDEKNQRYVFYNHRSATPAIFMGVVVFLCVALLFGIVIGIRSSVKISSVEVSGDTQYSRKELMAAAGIDIGDKLHKINVQEAEDKILEACPYLFKVNLAKGARGVLTIMVEESEPKYYILSGNGAFVLDADFRLLEISEDASVWKQSGVVGLELANPTYTKLGAPIKFGGENALGIDQVEDILYQIYSFGYGEAVDYVALADKYELYFTCGDRFKVVLGDSSELSEKLKRANLMMKTYEDSNQKGLVVNVFDLDSPFVGSR